jgi:hypothetical protein
VTDFYLINFNFPIINKIGITKVKRSGPAKCVDITIDTFTMKLKAHPDGCLDGLLVYNNG